MFSSDFCLNVIVARLPKHCTRSCRRLTRRSYKHIFEDFFVTERIRLGIENDVDLRNGDGTDNSIRSSFVLSLCGLQLGFDLLRFFSNIAPGLRSDDDDDGRRRRVALPDIRERNDRLRHDLRRCFRVVLGARRDVVVSQLIVLIYVFVCFLL